jgi:hypothetical protein
LNNGFTFCLIERITEDKDSIDADGAKRIPSETFNVNLKTLELG